jgi:acetoin utilization deacetylase AcuC-like enzyme
VHEYPYVERISRVCNSIPDHPNTVANLDGDTGISRWSFEAALRAAGSVCDAVDKVVAGDCRNAFCSVRPPGHHAGPRGIVKCANDLEGSHGFCLLNNVAIGAAYARSMYRHDGIRKVAIIDFDVHHGNGTEEIIRQLVPDVETTILRTPFADGHFQQQRYRPWLDESDVNDVFFASTHGYGPRTLDDGSKLSALFSLHRRYRHLLYHSLTLSFPLPFSYLVIPPHGGWFYPGSGETHTTDAILNPSIVETPNLTDFLLSQSWARMGEDSRANCCKIIDCGLSLPEPDAIPGMQRLELRDVYRKRILPYLREFDPDMIFISAGFDAHKKDSMNYGYVGMVEDDYEWVTEQLVKIANTCCNGRIVSVLEGGYKLQGGIVSPFARSVASHLRGLVDGGRSRELYDPEDCNWESQFERHVVEDRERKRRQKQEKLQRMAVSSCVREDRLETCVNNSS